MQSLAEACTIEIGKFYMNGYDELVYTFGLSESVGFKPFKCPYDWDEVVSVMAIKVNKYINVDNRFNFCNVFTNLTVHRKTMHQIDVNYIWTPYEPRQNTIDRFRFTSKEMSAIFEFLLHVRRKHTHE